MTTNSRRLRIGFILLGTALLVAVAGCGQREPTTEERMQELMADQDRQLGQFGRPPQPVDGGAVRGPAGEVLNWKITVTNYTVEDTTGDSLGLLWKYTDAHVRIVGGMKPRDGGLRLGYAGVNFAAELDAQRRQTKSSSKTESMLVVMKDHTGLMTVGQTRFVPAFVHDGRTIGGTLLKTEAVQSLVVKPESTPEGLVKVSLTPQFSRLEGLGDILLTQMTTTLLVKPGQAVVIGGDEAAQNQVTGSLFYHHDGSKNSKTLIVLRVDGM